MFIINDSGQTKKSKKYAIFYLCYRNDYYVMGLLCSLKAHMKLLNTFKEGNEIDLVVMCDEYIYNYHDYFKEYCDRVIVINMDLLPEHHKLYKLAKYSKKWMDYIINKWHCLYFEEYQKILFTDIDILPCAPSVYDIFTYYKEPYIFSCRNFKKCQESKYYSPDLPKTKYASYEDYILQGTFFIDAGFIILTPNKQLHDEYFKFVNKINFTNKNTVSQGSGIDETSLYYFLSHIKKVDYNCTKKEDTPIIPWDRPITCASEQNVSREVPRGKLFNYLSSIKPFIKPIPLMWEEEYIWKILEKQIITGNKFLKALSIRNALYCYLYLNKKDDSLKIVKKEKKHDIYNFINKLKQKMSISDNIFSQNAYSAIQESYDILFSYTDELNKLNGDEDIIAKCCGLIYKEKYRLLMNP